MENKMMNIPDLTDFIDFKNCKFNVLGNSDNYSLNNMHTNSGYNNHNNSGSNSHTKSGYSNHNNSGCGNHSQYGYSNYYNYTGGCYNNWSEYFNYHPGWVNRGHKQSQHHNGGCGNHTNSGYSNHTNSGANNHTDTGYSNHTNNGSNTHSNYSNNFSPTINGSCLPRSGIFNQSLTLDWRGCKIVHQHVNSSTAGSDSGTNAVAYYKIYYKRGSGKWYPWIQPGSSSQLTATSQTVTVNTAKTEAGVITFLITAHDGIEESAIYNSSSGSFTSPPGGYTSGGQPTATPAPGATYITTGELSISHYKAPEWKNAINPNQTAFRSYDIKEVHDEIRKAQDAYTLSMDSAISTPTPQRTKVSRDHLVKAQTDGNRIYKYVNGSEYTFKLPATNSVKNKTTHIGREILDLRNLVEGLD